MSFTLLLAVTAAVAASMGYLAARKRGDDDAPPDSGDENAGRKKEQEKEKEIAGKPAPKPQKKPPAAAPSLPFATLPLALGDVVQTGTEERWLAGAIVAREGGRVIGALFFAPEGVVQQAVAVFAPPRKDIWWMSPAAITSPDEPPATIEIGAAAMPRKGRLPVTLERLGQGVPPMGEEGLWAVYDRGREVALVIASHGTAHGWSGVRLEEDEYDRLGGGGD